MAGPFDFLQNVGQDISGAENTVGGWLKSLLPSQPAQPQNPPLPTPSVSASPLGGLSPTGGVPVSAPQPQPQQSPMDWQMPGAQQGKTLGGLLDYMKGVGDQLGGAKDLATQDMANILSHNAEWQPGNDVAGIPAHIAFTGTNPVSHQNQQLAKAVTNPIGYIGDVVNAGIMDPLSKVQAGPETWMSLDPNSPFATQFIPAYERQTGRKVPPTGMQLQQQAQDLTAQGQALDKAYQSLTPQSSQQDIDAYNTALAAYDSKVQQFKTQYAQSQDFWQNDPLMKALHIGAFAVTLPLEFEVGSKMFLPQLINDPAGQAQGMVQQIQQAGQFFQQLTHPDPSHPLTQDDVLNNISNLISLAAMGFGGGKYAFDKLNRGKAITPDEQRSILNKVKETDPKAPGGPIDQAAAIDQARKDSPVKEPPAAIDTRIADLQHSLAVAQKQLHTETDPAMKRVLIEQVSGLTDEIQSLRGQPRQAPMVLPEERTVNVPGFEGMTPDQIAEQIFGSREFRKDAVTDHVGNFTVDTVETPDAGWETGVSGADGTWYILDRYNNTNEAMSGHAKWAQYLKTNPKADLSRLEAEGIPPQEARDMAAHEAVQAAAREKAQELGPSKRVPEVIADPTHPDYAWGSDKILGPNYHFLEPRPEDFSLSAKAPTTIGKPIETLEDFAQATPVEIRQFLEDTRFKPIKVEQFRGNGWIDPTGKVAIPISSYDYSAHEEFFSTAGLANETGDESRVLMQNGWIKASNIAGMQNFGVRGMTEAKAEAINRAITADLKTGKPPYPYQIADELTGNVPVEVTPEEFAANGFDITPIYDQYLRRAGLITYTQGEQIGTQGISEAGQAGAPSEGLNRPEGTPEGTTLAAVIPSRVEGQTPVAVWEAHPEPAGAVPGGSRSAQLAAKSALIDSAMKAVSRVEDTELKRILQRGIQEEINKISPEEMAKFVEQRKKDLLDTYVRVREKYDPEGYVQHFVYDNQTESDAYFSPGQYRSITFHPEKMLAARWSRIMGEYFNRFAIQLKEDLPADKYTAAKNYLDQWATADQASMDENTIAEEIGHAYDFDHYASLWHYLQAATSDPAWNKIAYEAGFGPAEGQSFDDSVFGKVNQFILKPDAFFTKGPKGEAVLSPWGQYIFTNVAEYRASLFKVYKKAPLAGYTYRSPEVFKNELKDPSLIQKAAEAYGRDFEARQRPSLRRVIAAQTTRPSEAATTGAFQRGVAPTGAEPTVGPERTAGAPAMGIEATTPGAPTWRGGPAGTDQAGLTTSVRGPGGPTEREALGLGRKQPEPTTEEIARRTVVHQAVTDLRQAGWPEDRRWEEFTQDVSDPNAPGHEAAMKILDKLPPKTQEIFMQAVKALPEPEIQGGPALGGRAIRLGQGEEVPSPPTVSEIRSPQFARIQQEISAAEVKIKESGPIIDKMVASGESLRDINTARAQQADLRAYIDALKSGRPPKEAVQLGRQAFTAELNRLNEIKPGSASIPELEEPYQAVYRGKKYAAVDDRVADFLVKRLRLLNFDLPVDKAGNVGLNEFFDGLFAEDRAAEKAYKQLPQATKEYLEAKIGYRGVPFRGKGKQAKAVELGSPQAVAPGTENYINQTDLEGLEKAIAIVPEKGGFIAIRHGSTARNGGGGKVETLRGWDDVPLDANGEKQAERLAQAFAGKNVSVIYASPLKRSLDTAYAIAKVTGAKVVVDENLKPMHLGEWTGKPAADFGPKIADMAQNRPDVQIPGGESWMDYVGRYLPAVKKHMMDALNQDGLTIEVNHSRGVRTLKGHVMGGGQGLDVNMDPLATKEEVGPGGLMGLKFENGRWQIASGNIIKKIGETDKGEPVTKTEFASAEASQKYEIPQGVQPVAPRKSLHDVYAEAQDPVVTSVKKDVKQIQAAEKKAAKIKGELPATKDLSTLIDAIAADPSHPANAAAVKAQTLRDLMPKAEKMGGAAYERARNDYAVELQRFTSRMLKVAKEEPKVAEHVAPVVTDQKLFDKTTKIAQDLRKKIDAGADRNDVAKDAAKAMGLSLKQALGKMHDKNWGASDEAKNWSPAFQDLLLGKAGQVIREAKLSNKKLKPVIPLDLDKVAGDTKEYKPKKSPDAKPASARPKVVEPAVKKILNRTVSTRETPKEVPGDKVVSDTKKKADEDHVAHGKKDTKTLRKEVDEIHKTINTPSPNPFIEGEPKNTQRVDRVAMRKERRRQGFEEPGMKDGDSGQKPPPPKNPGELLAGWGDAYEPARSYEGLKDMADRMDAFVKKLALRVDPGRNQGHPIEQARQYIEAAVGDRYRRDGIMKAMEDWLGGPKRDIEIDRRIRRAIEGNEAQRTEAKRQLDPEEAAFADMWHSYEEVVGRIKSSADRELMKAAVQDHLSHILKFNEKDEPMLDKKGNVNAAAVGSRRVKFWVNRAVDPVTGEVRFPTIDSLIENFGADKVEEDLTKIFNASTSAFINKMRIKELIDDLSGHYITNDVKYKLSPAMFTEREVRPGFKGLGGRGLQPGDPRYVGRAIVPEGKEYDQMHDNYKDQLRRVNLGPYKTQLRNYWVYKPLAEQLERYAEMEEAMGAWDKAGNAISKANSVYKLYKFGFNPIHMFNLLTNMDAMAGRYRAIPNFSLYPKIFGRVDKLISGKGVWETPVGDFSGDEAIAKVIDAGAVVRDQLIDTANLGGLQGVLARKVPGFKQWHNFMWHGVAWKGQIGLAMHLTDKISEAFEEHFDRPPTQAEFDNILRLSTQNAKYAMGFLDRADMTRDWRMIGNSAFFANSWSSVQIRMFGKFLQAMKVPGGRFLANFGGGERYNTFVTKMMKDMGGMDQETLDWINSQDGALAKNYVLGGALKLLATSVALNYAGSTIAVLTGQPNAQMSGPWNNFMRDPTHTFDIYLGTDPATGKDKWQHNPLYGMIQEMALYGLAAVKEARNGGNPYDVAEAPVLRYAFGKMNPMFNLVADLYAQREMSMYYNGFGDKADIQQDPSIVAIQRALNAKGINLPVGLMDNLIYAWRAVGPMPSFAPTVHPDNQLNNWGDIMNAMGTGQYFGAGDFWNAIQSGNMSDLYKFDLGNLAQYMLGSRQSLSATPAQVALNNQYEQASANKAQTDAAVQQMTQAAYKGDYQTILNIANQQGFDNNQMLNSLEHPPSGSGGGILYHGTPYTGGGSAMTQDTLMGYTLKPNETTQLEALKKAHTLALYNQLTQDPEWQSATGSERGAMLASIERQVMKAVENQYAQQIGLMGGAQITNDDIQGLIDNELQLRNVASGVVATNSYYTQADPIQQARMMSEYKTFADQLSWDMTFGSLKGLPPENAQAYVEAAINTEEGTRQYLQGSIFYQMASPDEQVRMLSEYSTLSRTVAKRYALEQGQGPRGDIRLSPDQLLPVVEKTIDIEEYAKAVLHGTDYYNTSDTSVQSSLDGKYATLARSLAFSPAAYGDPRQLIDNSINSEQSYFDLQNQFGGSNYVKLMAQQLSDLELTMRQGTDLSPKQISAEQKALRAMFLAQNPAYAQYIKAKTWWGRNTTDGQIYNALNNSEYAAVDDLAQQDVAAQDSLLLSGTPGSDPYFDPAANMGLADLGNGTLGALGSVDPYFNSIDGSSASGTPPGQ